jgi:hypothetical protein
MKRESVIHFAKKLQAEIDDKKLLNLNYLGLQL